MPSPICEKHNRVKQVNEDEDRFECPACAREGYYDDLDESERITNFETLLTTPPAELEGAHARLRSHDATLDGEIIEVYDDPSGVRRLLIKQPPGVVKAIPLWRPADA